MAKVIDPSKLLPSAKSSAIARVGKSKSTNIIAKISPLSKASLAKKENKDVIESNNKLVKVDKFLKSDLIVSQKKAEVKRKYKEKEDFSEAEKKLEAPKEARKFNLPTLSIPGSSFLDRIKRFLFFTALGWLFTKFQDQLPKLIGIVKTITQVYGVAENIFKFLLESFVNFIDRGYQVYDRVRGLAKSIGGEKAQQDFDNLSSKLNEYINYALIGGMALTGAINTFGKEIKGPKQPLKPIRPTGPTSPKTPIQKATQVARIGAKKAVQAVPGKQAAKQLLRVVKGPLSKLPIIGGLIEFGLSWALGDPVGKAAFRGVGTLLLGAVGSLILPGFGTFVGGIVGAELAAKLYEVLFENKRPQGKIQKKQGGGSITRGGRPVGGSRRRSITPARRRSKVKFRPPKSQPGKDVGGEAKIKRLYPDTDPKAITAKDWISSAFAGTYQQFVSLVKGETGKKPNPYKALTKTAKILKEIPLVGGIMGGAVDIALGQKPDSKIYNSFSTGIGHLVETLANQRVSTSMTSLMKDIQGFAGGGNVPPSRELKGTYGSLGSGDMIAKVLSPTIDQRVNEAIQSIEKELQKREEKKKEEKKKDSRGKFEDGRRGAPSGGPSVESIDMSGLTSEDVDALGRMVQAEAGNQSNAGKAAVMNVILNRYRLAKAGKGYLPRGKTKDTVTIRDILYAPNQFSPIDDGRFDKTSSAAGRSALAQAISAGGNDPEKLKKVLMEKYKLNERDAEYVVVSTAFSNPKSRGSRPFNTKEIDVGDHTFQESPYVRLTAPGQKIDASVEQSQYSGNLSNQFLRNLTKSLPGITLGGQRYRASRDEGTREHAGRDYDLPDDGVFYSRLGGEVIFAGNVGGGYGNVVDIYNKDLNRTERIAEGTTILSGIKVGSIISPGQPVVQGTHQTGVIHYEIRQGKAGSSGSVKGTEDPDAFLNSSTYKQYIAKVGSASTAQNLQSVQNKIANMKPDDAPITIPGVGRVVIKKNQYGTIIKEYYDSNNNKIDSSRFFELVKKTQSTVQRTGGQRGSGTKPTTTKPQVAGSGMGGRRGSGARITTRMQGGGLIAPKKPNRPIPDSFASYETPGGGMMIAIQPMIIEKSVPVGRSKNPMIEFPVAAGGGVNNNKGLSVG